MLALLTVTAAVPVGAATPANAGNGHETAGINKAAGSVTTHSGKVISGITFVSGKDILAVRRQLAKSAAQTSAVTAAEFTCWDSWHYIKAGPANSYWKPQGPYNYIWANGNRSADYWNQQFLPCFWTSWPEPNSWAFLANANGQFVDHFNLQLRANTPTYVDEGVLTRRAKFLVCDYDAVWAYLYSYTGMFDDKLYAYRDPATAATYSALGPLSGNHLFHIDPPVTESGAGLCALP